MAVIVVWWYYLLNVTYTLSIMYNVIYTLTG